jgi:hypothetical protein
LVGGWQVAGAGFVQFTDFNPVTTMWGATNPLKIYKKSAPITDCRSGKCLNSYEWFNGYLPPTVLSSSYTVGGQAGCVGAYPQSVTGLPTSWQPFQTTLDSACMTSGTASTAPVGDTVNKVVYFGTEDVYMNNINGQTGGAVVGYGDVPANNDNGSSEAAIDVTNPYRHTTIAGPWEWSADASLFKVFPITERLNVRMNVDAFNVFNHQGIASAQGNSTPNTTDGTVCTSAGGVGCYSYNQARTLQLTLRINF